MLYYEITWWHEILPPLLILSGYGFMFIKTFYSPWPFGKASLRPWINHDSPLPPSHHNHTSNLINCSFSPVNQLRHCAPFHHLLSCDSIILSFPPLPPPPEPPPLTLYSVFFSIFIFFHFITPVIASGSTLTHPSARAQTNPSLVVLFHKDQKQLVSSHVSRFFLVSVLLHLSAWSSHWMLDYFHPACVHALWTFILSRSHIFGFKHGSNQGRFILVLFFTFRIFCL